MANERHTHQLTGCAPTPLAHYLKALGILRLVAEQADASAQGWWAGDVFHLRTTLDQESLVEFFLENYRPTPLVGPWGARSGFFSGGSEKSAREALAEIESSESDRLMPFREAIVIVRQVLARLKLTDKAETPDDKRRLMMQCRASFPDSLLAWLDATYVLLDTETKYPPLLGTGGNEGSGSYMSGFAQQVAAVFIERAWDHALLPALWGTSERGLGSSQTPGHFSPEAAGGPNAASTSEGNVVTNPWDYVLLLEGTLLFAAAAVKRMELRDGGTLGYPFCVQQAGVGYASADSSDELNSRAEMWLPLWPKPSTANELSALFSEGRAQVGGRTARNGVDFARALAGLGTDRGIDEYQRYGFQQRNGLSYFAVPLGRFQVDPNPKVDLLAEPKLDGWLAAFRRAATSDSAPSRVRRVLCGLESAILDLCQQKGSRRLQAVLIALGEAEAVLAVSSKWRERDVPYLRPVPLLSPQWLTDAYEESSDRHGCEFRLAASLAGLHSSTVGGFRQYLEPVTINGKTSPESIRWVEWTDDSTAARDVVWNAGSLESNLIAILQRRSIEAVQKGSRADDGLTLVFPGESDPHASLSDVAAFLADETVDERLAALTRGLTLIDWAAVCQAGTCNAFRREPMADAPDAAYSLLKLCHTPYRVRDQYVRFDPTITRLACAGRLKDATRLAVRRLRGSGLPPAIDGVVDSSDAKRIAAALLFPMASEDVYWSHPSRNTLAKCVLQPQRILSTVK